MRRKPRRGKNVPGEPANGRRLTERPAAATTTAKRTEKPSVAIVGAGRLANFLAVALRDAGFAITEIIARDLPQSRQRALTLATGVGARAVTVRSAAFDAALLWFCVPDGEIRNAAWLLSDHLLARTMIPMKVGIRFALHSSGALAAGELAPLRTAGVAVASVHPLMTFVAGAQPSLAGVPFALEGDAPATKLARRIVRDLGGESFLLPARRKAAYHAWATMTSPLLVAYLVTLEEAARAAGFSREVARRMSLPIIRQTVANYASLGPDSSFSGPFIRGDAKTVEKHLALLEKNASVRAVYGALARAALVQLPVKNREELRRLLEGSLKKFCP